jgi:hypothetical protein
MLYFLKSLGYRPFTGIKKAASLGGLPAHIKTCTKKK